MVCLSAATPRNSKRKTAKTKFRHLCFYVFTLFTLFAGRARPKTEDAGSADGKTAKTNFQNLRFYGLRFYTGRVRPKSEDAGSADGKNEISTFTHLRSYSCSLDACG